MNADLSGTPTDHLGHSRVVLVEGLRAQDSRGIKCLTECGEDVAEHRLSTERLQSATAKVDYSYNAICSWLRQHAHERMEARGMQNA